MGVTQITRVVNNSDGWVYIQNHESPNQPQPGCFEVLPPKDLLSSNNEVAVSISVPWCTSQGDFDAHKYIEIGTWVWQYDQEGVWWRKPFTKYVLWQHHRWGGWWGGDGDRIRFSRDGQWHNVNGNWVPGASNVDGRRRLRIDALDSDSGLFLENIS